MSNRKTPTKPATAIHAPSVAELRHPAEVPMLVVGAIVTILAAFVALSLIAAGASEIPNWAFAGLFAFLIPVAAGLVYIRYGYWSTISNAIPVTEKQFPELNKLYHDLAVEMGFTGKELDALPPLYVLNGNGTLNAYSSKCQLQKAYVVLYSDLLDVAYSLNDFTTVRFVLAHELGHIKCRHVSLWRLILAPVSGMLFLRPSIIRAQEYTADRVASYYAPDGAPGLTVLYAGKRMYQGMDVQEYYRSIHHHKDGFWLRVSNFLSTHPVGFRRMEALSQVPTKGWDVAGRMV